MGKPGKEIQWRSQSEKDRKSNEGEGETAGRLGS